MNDRKSRMGEIAKIHPLARMDYRNTLNKAGRPFWEEGMTRKDRRILRAEGKKIGIQYTRIIKALYSSGVGFPVDQTTRQMAVEYTNRFASSGTGNLPVSFNYFEPFCDLKLINGTVAPYMVPVPEINHLFNVTDFFDFLTSNDSESFSVTELISLPEARTLHFTNNGDISEITFFDATGREYILSGFSMVRRGNSIHWFLVAGEKLNKEQWDLRAKDIHEINIDDVPPWKRAFLKERIERTGPTTGAPMKLEGTETAVRTLVAGEFDVSIKKHIGKSIFIETENSYGVFSDDPEILASIDTSDKKQKIIDSAMERIREADILWNIAEGLFQLPQYFETRATVSRNLLKGHGKQAGLKGKGGRGIKANYVAVEAVAIENSDPPSVIRRIRIPLYATETEGHWRRLKIGRMGKDRDGNPVQDKTWVKKSNPWRNERHTDGIVYVKDCLAVAKTQITNLYAAAETQNVDIQTHDSGNGELYVLRCPLMKDDIYKVGWTSGTADERSKQLSSATGVPLAFIVVESWAHDDPEALETEVHAQLAPYRVNNQREFFQLHFTEIREIILRTIDRVSRAELVE